MTAMTRSFSRRAAIAAALALLVSQAAPAQELRGTSAPASDGALTGAARTQALARASASLNQIRLLQGRFRQISPDGRATTGQFYMQRPGRLRFAYDSPATMLIVADGSVLAVQDTALRSVNRAPLRTTPLYFVLKNDINLDRDARITRVIQRGQTLLITARDRTGDADGEITLMLSGPSLQLTSWDVVDAMGGRTRLSLSDLTTPSAIDSRLFRSPQPTATGRPR